MTQAILIVDDQKDFLAAMTEGLPLVAGELDVVTAPDSKAALRALASRKFDLVVTGLEMPEMGGFALLSHMGARYPDIPVIVMTARTNPDVPNPLGDTAINHLAKPVTPASLIAAARRELEMASKNRPKRISLFSFLQLIEMEKKTCSVRVESEGRVGYFNFRDGVLWWVKTQRRSGEEAAFEMFGWKGGGVGIWPGRAEKKRNIVSSLSDLLVEVFAARDGGTAAPTEAAPGKIPEKMEDGLSEDKKLSGRRDEHPSDKPSGKPNPTKEAIMALEKHLQSLREIKGFKAAAIMSYTGEVLASESADPSIDLQLVGATFNDIFRSAHDASKKIGLDACHETVISTPKGIVIMACSGTAAKIHFHMLGVMASDGNQALMKMQIEKAIPVVMGDL